MNLSNDIYLRSAFRELDAFAIEGIGTFRKIYHSAHEETFSGDIYPPSVEVEFKERVEEDLLLEFYLAESLHLNKNTSVGVVEDIRKGIEGSIEVQGYYEIAGIGKLKRSNAGNIYFMPVETKDNIFSSDFYGLQPVPLHTESNQADQTTNDTMTSEENQFEPHSSQPKGYWFGWKAAAFLGVVLLFGLLLIILDWPMQATLKRASLVEGPKIRNIDPEELLAENKMNNTNPEQIETESPALTGASESESPAETDTRGIQSNDFEPIASNEGPEEVESSTPESQKQSTRSTASSKEPAVKSSTTTSNSDTRSGEGTTRGGVTRGAASSKEDPLSTGKNISILSDNNQVARTAVANTFYVISGSFEGMFQARSAAEQMRKQGYQNVTIVQADKKYRVSIFSTLDEALAESIKNEARRKGVKDAWVYSQ